MMHTPGPWSVDISQEVWGLFRVRPHAMNGALSLRDAIATDEANARLIAAAPDLLDACKFLLSVIDVVRAIDAPSPIDRIKAAVAKAEGL